MGHVDGLANTGKIRHHLEPAEDAGAVPDGQQIALEMSKIDGIEADNGGKEADVSLGQLLAGNEEFILAEDLLDALQSLKDPLRILFIYTDLAFRRRCVHSA